MKLITNDQMTIEVNQRGYDVVGVSGERASVKTTAMMGSNGHITSNAKSLEFRRPCDRTARQYGGNAD